VGIMYMLRHALYQNRRSFHLSLYALLFKVVYKVSNCRCFINGQLKYSYMIHYRAWTPVYHAFTSLDWLL